MRGCILVSVRNTGTHFWAAVLEEHFERHYLTEDLRSDPLWLSHTETDKMGAIRAKAADYPLFLPMRHPMDVARSWMRRGKGMDHWFRAMWRNLFELKAGFEDSYWLPIDTTDREGYLDAARERLRAPLATDWVPRGVTGNDYPYRGGMTLLEAQEFFLTLPFGQFYGDISRDQREGG